MLKRNFQDVTLEEEGTDVIIPALLRKREVLMASKNKSTPPKSQSVNQWILAGTALVISAIAIGGVIYGYGKLSGKTETLLNGVNGLTANLTHIQSNFNERFDQLESNINERFDRFYELVFQLHIHAANDAGYIAPSNSGWRLTKKGERILTEELKGAVQDIVQQNKDASLGEVMDRIFQRFTISGLSRIAKRQKASFEEMIGVITVYVSKVQLSLGP